MFRVRLEQGLTSAEIEICSDPVCAVQPTIRFPIGDQLTRTPTRVQTAEHFWWRAYGLRNGVRGLAPTSTRLFYSTPGTFEGSSTIGRFADFDGDGFSNLMEFALGLDPNLNSPDGGPLTTVENSYLTLTANRNPAATGLQFRIAVSDNLTTWFSDAAHVTTLENTPALLRARDNMPIDSAQQRFIRLEVRKP